MNLIIILITILFSRHVMSQLGYSYNIFSDPFDLTLFLIDIGLFILVYWVLHFSYTRTKLIVQNSMKKYR
ncbi:hypothetical protein BCT42_13840 [Vibrio lentus]|uniref:DUF3955 domain-containing protein n=1 Tax=Vibrio lentus TaxID=136468 RepID=A0A2N7IIC5_9VIBR|nr:hypothetical protein BCU45_10435 [Vibrio lentus]PMI64465.1 hypothetical protein BCU40_15960 [Vibrio lentus]PMJ56281.1 hypothetical protein BCU20_19915 [Vibrio lentus]PMJ60553.1 hypothetical protein BCU18_07595 [Vibrio lentus]PML57380.1 hypothetical protein BCT74_19150 [Vibrio lentus]